MEVLVRYLVGNFERGRGFPLPARPRRGAAPPPVGDGWLPQAPAIGRWLTYGGRSGMCVTRHTLRGALSPSFATKEGLTCVCGWSVL